MSQQSRTLTLIGLFLSNFKCKHIIDLSKDTDGHAVFPHFLVVTLYRLWVLPVI